MLWNIFENMFLHHHHIMVGHKILVLILCRTCVVLSAVLLYFHFECLADKEERDRDMFNDVYIPDQTDCLAEQPFVKISEKEVIQFIGRSYVHCQVAPSRP